MTLKTVYVDALIGPTYHFGGLALGNLYSMRNKHAVSNPRKAALEGLEKMKRVLDSGCDQYIFPPIRKNLSDCAELLSKDVLTQADLEQVAIRQTVATYFSASAAWMANACTATASLDTHDSSSHLTTANLSFAKHRSLDAMKMHDLMHKFVSDTDILLHEPFSKSFGDEGMANTIRLSGNDFKGLYLSVFGKSMTKAFSKQFPARHHKETALRLSEQQHRFSEQEFIIQQHPDAIDAGVFHNDVISFGMHNVLFVHERAFVNQTECMADIKQRYQRLFGQPLFVYEFLDSELTLSQAVASYFFNSQLLRLGPNHYKLLLPHSCEQLPQFSTLVRRFNDFNDIHIDWELVNCEESLKNGGGPACLRFFLQDKASILESLNPAFQFDLAMYERCKAFVQSRYPDSLSADDLFSLAFLKQQCQLIDELYSFWALS